jgi:propanol-preferring alcohol dehydrogenase
MIDTLRTGVRGWSVGHRVGLGFLGGHCGVWSRVAGGRFVASTDQPWTGLMRDGGYAEVAYARASGLVAIPEELTDLDAAPLLSAGFTTFNALVRAGAKAGDLAVQGIGGLGLLSVHYAAKMGMEVVAIARGTTKEELARALGADYYIDRSPRMRRRS